MGTSLESTLKFISIKKLKIATRKIHDQLMFFPSGLWLSRLRYIFTHLKAFVFAKEEPLNSNLIVSSVKPPLFPRHASHTLNRKTVEQLNS